MGVLPLQFMPGDDRKSLKLSGDETVDVLGLDGEISANQQLDAVIHYPSGESVNIKLLSRLDTGVEVDYYQAGGVLTYVLNRIVAKG
jgi:aconitate hydratase